MEDVDSKFLMCGHSGTAWVGRACVSAFALHGRCMLCVLVCCHSVAARVCKACALVPGLCEGACGASIHQLVSGGTLAQDRNCGCQLRSSHSQVLLYGKKLDVPRRMLPS